MSEKQQNPTETTPPFICNNCELMCKFGAKKIDISDKEYINSNIKDLNATYYMPTINNTVISSLSYKTIQPSTSEQQAIKEAHNIAKYHCLIYKTRKIK